MNIDEQFDKAVSIVQGLPKAGPIQTDYEQKLEMYSLYKQATVGNVDAQRPGIWDMLGRAKWDAWSKHKGMPQAEAKILYVETLRKVLKKYSDKTAAKDLIQDLEASTSQTPSADHFVTVEARVHSQASSSSSSTSSSGRGQEEPPPPLPSGALPYPSHLQPALRGGTIPLGAQLTSEEESSDENEEIEGNDRHGPLRSVPHPEVGIGFTRPRSAVSSQQRYRTPLGAPSSPPFSPLISTAPGPPSSIYRSTIATQPLPSFATPSVFDNARDRANSDSNLPTSAFLRSSYSQPSQQSPYHITAALQQTQPQFYSNQRVPTDRTPGSGHRSIVSSLTHPQLPPPQSLERTIEIMQGHITALTERLERLEDSRLYASPSSRLGRGQVVHSHTYSPQGHSDPREKWDVANLGMWSIFLKPLAQTMNSFQSVGNFFLSSSYAQGPSQPGEASPSPVLVIVRRLFLDASFVLFLLTVTKIVWKRSGVRRREVRAALRVLWFAVLGKGLDSSGYLGAPRGGLRVDRGV